MRKQLQHLPKPVARTLISFYRRVRFYGLMRSLVAPLLCYALLALIATHVDRFLFLDGPARLWLSGITHGFSLLAVVVSVWAFVRRRVPVSTLAYELERMLPKATAERVVTLNDVMGRQTDSHQENGGVHAMLLAQLTAETVTLCERLPHAARLARDRHLKRQIRGLALLALVYTGLFALPTYQFPLMLQRLTYPRMNLPKPSFMRLTVTPESAVIGRGGEVVLQVQVEGEIPRLLRHPLRWLGADASRSLLASATGDVAALAVTSDARPMSRVQSRLFVSSLTDLQESFSYLVRCGDAQTDIRFVHVVAQPRATGVSVEVEPPPYTRLQTTVFDDFRDPIPVFGNSHLKVRFGSDQFPLKAARLMALHDGSLIKELNPDPVTHDYVYEFEMTSPIDFEIVLVNAFEFENNDRVRIMLQLREDQPPGIRLEYPAGDITAVQGDLVPMHMELTDDLGLLEGSIRYQINPDQTGHAGGREIALLVEEGSLQQTLSAMFDLEASGAVPGDEVLLWVRIRDTGRIDERSQSVRIRVTALAGNENERRRLVALRLVGQMLKTIEPAADAPGVLVLNATSYEAVTAAAKAQNLLLNSEAALQSLLDFLEREHHFTDSPDAALDVRLLRGVIAARLELPLKYQAGADDRAESRTAALHQMADELLSPLMCERMGRDLIRRAISLRNETRATVSASSGDTQRPRNRATFERRVDLLMEALDSTSADMVALTRISPLVNSDTVLGFTRQISRAVRDLKVSDPSRQQVANKTICDQIDGWIGLLLPALPEWNAQRRAARTTLQGQYDAIHEVMLKAWRTVPQTMSAEETRWLATDARMIERSPFLGLTERLDTTPNGPKRLADPATQAAADCESAWLSQSAIASTYAAWSEGARVTPVVRRLAAVLKAVDSATTDVARAAALDRLRMFDSNTDATDSAVESPPVSCGLYAHLPALTEAPAGAVESYDEAIARLAADADALLGGLKGMTASADPASVPDYSPGLVALESGLTTWEADVLRLTYQIHIDLSYGDPRREQTARLSLMLPALRAVIDRYEVVVPPLISRLRNRARKTSGADGPAAVTLDLEDLDRRVASLGSGLKRAAELVPGDPLAGVENYAVRDVRSTCTAARMLAEAKNPVAVAEAFFAQHPAAAALVIEQRMPLFQKLKQHINQAVIVLPEETAVGAAFLDAMRQTERLVDEMGLLIERFGALDGEGTVREIAADTRARVKALIRPDRGAGAATLARDRLALDELQRQMEVYEYRVRELITKYSPPTSSGWWGGPVGIWDGVSRRDAEHARSRMMAQYDRARREAVLGFNAVISQRSESAAALPDAPLASALFAWRTLHSSLGGDTVMRIPKKRTDLANDPWMVYLLGELEKMRKSVRTQNGGGVRRYKEPTSRLPDSLSGYLMRRGL